MGRGKEEERKKKKKKKNVLRGLCEECPGKRLVTDAF